MSASAVRCPHCNQILRTNVTALVESLIRHAKAPRSVATVKALVREQREASNREIYNALTGLVRSGRIERLSYGLYSARTGKDKG